MAKIKTATEKATYKTGPPVPHKLLPNIVKTLTTGRAEERMPRKAKFTKKRADLKNGKKKTGLTLMEALVEMERKMALVSVVSQPPNGKQCPRARKLPIMLKRKKAQKQASNMSQLLKRAK